MCNESYHQDPEAEDGKNFEVPEAATSEAWSEDEFIGRHAPLPRPLPAEALYVRGYLEAVDALRAWEEASG